MGSAWGLSISIKPSGKVLNIRDPIAVWGPLSRHASDSLSAMS